MRSQIEHEIIRASIRIAQRDDRLRLRPRGPARRLAAALRGIQDRAVRVELEFEIVFTQTVHGPAVDRLAVACLAGRTRTHNG